MNGAPIPSFRVASKQRNPGPDCRASWSFDYAGSIASAIRHLEQRTATGLYSECFIQRMRVTKGRKRGSRRFLYASDPMMRRSPAAAVSLPKAA
jgi:hypothetical protein